MTQEAGKHPLDAKGVTQLPSRLNTTRLRTDRLTTGLIARTQNHHVTDTLGHLNNDGRFTLHHTGHFAHLFSLFVTVVSRKRRFLQTVTRNGGVIRNKAPLARRALRIKVPLARTDRLTQIRNSNVTVNAGLIHTVLGKSANVQGYVNGITRFTVSNDRSKGLYRDAIRNVRHSPFENGQYVNVIDNNGRCLNVFKTQRRFLRFLVLTQLEISLTSTLRNGTHLLSTTPLHAQNLFSTASLLDNHTQNFGTDAMILRHLRHETPHPHVSRHGIVHQVRRTLILILTTRVRRRTGTLQGLTRANGTTIGLRTTTTLNEGATLCNGTFHII